jgi:hypothetical protein
VVATPILIVANERWIDFGAWLPGVDSVISNGLIPAGLLIIALVGFYVVLRKKYSASKNEAVQTLFILLAAAFLVLTLAGVWFRGSGMALMWPWNL